jgi:uncharacterized protein (UPF0332 family)
VKTISDLLIAKAERAFIAAKSNLELEQLETSINRCYYCMFYLACALLEKKQLRFKSHSGVIGAFGKELVKTGFVPAHYHQYLRDSFDLRQGSDYLSELEVSLEDVAVHVTHAEEFLAFAKQYLKVDLD